jgi:hypothetical protein
MLGALSAQVSRSSAALESCETTKIDFLVLSTEKRVRRRNLKASAFMDQCISLRSAVQKICLGSSGFTVTICHYVVL